MSLVNTKSSVWDVQENDIFRMLDAGLKDADIKENFRHYVDIIRCAFEIAEIPEVTPAVKKAYTKQGYKVGELRMDEENKVTWGLRKKPIMRVTDLTYENIRHISAAKLIEVLDRNFGGGWDSLSQSIQDIILSGFDMISSRETISLTSRWSASWRALSSVSEGITISSMISMSATNSAGPKKR